MNIKKLLHVAWFTPGLNGRWGLNLLFEGKPGVGKSQTIESACAGSGLPCVTLIASLRDPTDFGGLPIPVVRGEGKGRTLVEYAAPGWAADLAIEKRGVIFVDELSQCAPAVQSALMRMVLNGALGDFELPPTIRFISAANATADAAGGWDLAAPLANRFGHLDWEMPDAGEWTEWLVGANGRPGEDEDGAGSPEAEEARVMKLWPKAFAVAKGLVAGFVRSRPELLFKMPERGDQNRSKAWPSPRTWEMACRAIAGSDVHGLDEVHGDALASAFVGAAAFGELATYRKHVDLPDPEDVLDGKVTFKHKPARLDRTMAVLTGCAAFVTSKDVKKQKERSNKLWEILGEVMDDAADITVPAARALVRAKLMQGDAVKPVLAKIQPILAAAGVRAGS